MTATHQVANQPPALMDFDPLDCDPALRAALGETGDDEITEIAAAAGSATAREHGRLANENPPTLRTHDRYGYRIDEVDFHPSWHWLMSRAVEYELHAAPWAPDAESDAHLRRAAGFYLWSQVEAGHGCPISMTFASIPALRHAPELAKTFEPGLRSSQYDFGPRAPNTKSGLLAGMSMTEKQGGSDVRANTTTAVPSSDGYRITGHKWFTSAPMNDVFLTLAQAPGGLSCFLVPRVLPDGSRNEIRLQRLKDKLGNKSNASAELEYAGAHGWLIGEEGRGVRYIIDMVSMTRLDCVLGSAANIRAALSEAAHHAQHRNAFGTPLREAPLMRTVLADLALESDAATTLAMRLASAADGVRRGDPTETALLRVALPASKFLVCKRAPSAVAEALECLGGNGYVEESGLPRLYREAPLMSLWEGSGNVTALDTLRALVKQPETADALLAELATTRGVDSRYDTALSRLRTALDEPTEETARSLAELIALTLQASLLLRTAPNTVADAFITTRLGEEAGQVFGARRVPEAEMLLNRVTPLVPPREMPTDSGWIAYTPLRPTGQERE